MELKEIRESLDKIDKEVLELFTKRMELVDKVTDIKRSANTPIYDPEREREILSKIHSMAKKPYDNAAHQLFRTILELSRARQAQKMIQATSVAAKVAAMCSEETAVFPQQGRVAISGIEGSNAQMAADALFPMGDLVYFDSFSAVVKSVKAGLCQFGVLPIENSNNGSIRSVYELIDDEDISIIRSVRLYIRHVLLGLRGADLSKIKTIYTHPQASAQCSKFLESLNNVDVVPCQSTAHAAKRVAQSGDLSCAAIASEACANLYGLSVINDEIQNQNHNDTRFWCITKGVGYYQGADKISLMLSCKNKSGALFDVIAKVAALGLNMCKLESVPIAGSNFAYKFYIDLEASLHQEGVLGLLSELERATDKFQLLGNYSEIIG
ncbi:MAG: prephenate dehydratase domain-containing protein [Clostridia bacterium]|nr:prephenate dehydratase domain-containing protein [Clostridia bacterium]